MMQTGSDSQPTCAVAVDLELFTAADTGAEIGCSPTSVKRISVEIKLPAITTKSGIHLYTRPMMEKIRAEIQRRELERLRR